MTPLFCPNPRAWHRVRQELDRLRRSAGKSISAPPVPLILNGWVFSSAQQKHDRWAETVVWANGAGLAHIVDSVASDEFVRWEHDEPAWLPEAVADDDAESTG